MLQYMDKNMRLEPRFDKNKSPSWTLVQRGKVVFNFPFAYLGFDNMPNEVFKILTKGAARITFRYPDIFQDQSIPGFKNWPLSKQILIPSCACWRGFFVCCQLEQINISSQPVIDQNVAPQPTFRICLIFAWYLLDLWSISASKLIDTWLIFDH